MANCTEEDLWNWSATKMMFMGIGFGMAIAVAVIWILGECFGYSAISCLAPLVVLCAPFWALEHYADRRIGEIKASLHDRD